MSRYEMEKINSLEDWMRTMVLEAYKNDEKCVDTNGMIVPRWQLLLERFYNA